MSRTNPLDLWCNIYRRMDNFSDPITEEVLNSLNNKVQEYNKLFGTNFQVFESGRSIARQLHLVAGGTSWANPDRAPHPEKRAIDFAELSEGVWYWNEDKLKALWTWLRDNFDQWKRLRTGGSFKHVSDFPHYEIRRDIWLTWQKSKGVS